MPIRHQGAFVCLLLCRQLQFGTHALDVHLIENLPLGLSCVMVNI